MTVTGIEHCKFENKEGKHVEFDRITLLSDIPEAKGEGQAAEIVNVSPEKSDGLEIGDEVEIYYNKYGKVSVIEILGGDQV